MLADTISIVIKASKLQSFKASRLQGFKASVAIRSLLIVVGMLGSGMVSQANPTEPPPKTPLEIARDHFKKREFSHAERLLTEALNSNPSSQDAAESYLLLGQAQERLKKSDEAIRTLAGCAYRFPGSEPAAKAIEIQAQIHARRNNPSEARRLHNQLLSQYPKSPTTIRIWGETADGLFNEGNFTEAYAIYQRLEGDLPAKTIRNIGAAKILSEGARDPRSIIPIAEQALADDERELATMLFEQLAKSPNAGSDLPKIQTRLAWCLSLQRDDESRDRAVKLWQEVVRSNRPTEPFHAEAKWHLVRHAAGPGRDWKKAVALCDEIIADQPAGSFRHEQALFSKAWLLTVHDQGEAAVAAFDEFAAAYPEKSAYPPIRRHRERAQESADKKSGSR